MADTNWREITPSGFAWEREALEHVQRHFPRHAPYAAWANFEFFDGGNRLYEVDLLLCTPKGLHLVEIKSWPGRIEGDDHTWRWTNPEGRTVAGTPDPVGEREGQGAEVSAVADGRGTTGSIAVCDRVGLPLSSGPGDAPD